MHARLVAVAALFCALPVFADPDPPPREHCSVTILRAPDRVRREVEKWVRAEPRCTTSLELRVVPTDGGLYLLARDDHGRVRERVVPDAQSVGVLVASWIADDGPIVERAPVAVAPPAPPVADADDDDAAGTPVADADDDDAAGTPAPTPVAEPAPFAEPTPAPGRPARMPRRAPPAPSWGPPGAGPALAPGSPAPGPVPVLAPPPGTPAPGPAPALAPGAPAPAVAPCAAPPPATPAPAPPVLAPPSAVPAASLPEPDPFVDVALRAVTHEQTGRWLTLGGARKVAGRASTGLRAELDIFHRRWWTLGLNASLFDSSESEMFIETSGSAEAFFAATKALGRWELRAQAGLGVAVVRQVDYYNSYPLGYGVMPMTFVDTHAVAEVALLVSRAIGDQWAFAAGPMINSNLTSRTWRDYGGYYGEVPRTSLLLFAGFRHRM